MKTNSLLHQIYWEAWPTIQPGVAYCALGCVVEGLTPLTVLLIMTHTMSWYDQAIL